MNNLPDCIIRHHIFEYLDISEYYNVSQVSTYFNDCLGERYDPKFLLKELKEYRSRKIRWFSNKLHNIPSNYLTSIKEVNIYLLLQDIYHNTNYIDRLKIEIPDKKKCIDSYLICKTNNSYKTRRHESILKKMKQDIHLSIDSSISKLNKKNYYSKKIKNINNKNE